MKKKLILAVGAFIGGLVILFWVMSRVREGAQRRYDETVAIMDGYTLGVAGVNAFTNDLRDAWGRLMSVVKNGDEWTVVSKGYDQIDTTDDITLIWNPKCHSVNIHYQYEGRFRNYGRNEEHDD